MTALSGQAPPPDLWEEAASWNTDSPPSAESGEILSALGLMYQNHGDCARALVLGLTALSLGDRSPRTALLIADALLKTGDSTQVLAVLSRFEAGTDALAQVPTVSQTAAKDYLKAIALFRQDDLEGARAALRQAHHRKDEMPG